MANNNILGKCNMYFIFQIFYAPMTIVRGYKDFHSVCPSVCLSIRHTLRYTVCVINSSHSFQWIFLKPCIPVRDILKMCMWVFNGARINFDSLTAYQNSHLGNVLHCRV